MKLTGPPIPPTAPPGPSPVDPAGDGFSTAATGDQEPMKSVADACETIRRHETATPPTNERNLFFITVPFTFINMILLLATPAPI